LPSNMKTRSELVAILFARPILYRFFLVSMLAMTALLKKSKPSRELSAVC